MPRTERVVNGWPLAMGIVINTLILTACVIMAFTTWRRYRELERQVSENAEIVTVKTTGRFTLADAERFAKELAEANPDLIVPIPRHE